MDLDVPRGNCDQHLMIQLWRSFHCAILEASRSIVEAWAFRGATSQLSGLYQCMIRSFPKTADALCNHGPIKLLRAFEGLGRGAG